MTDKTVPLEDLGDLVRRGDVVAIGGAWFANHPMAAVRQLVRDDVRGLHAVALIGSIDIDLLVAAGLVDHLTFSMVTLEAFGLAPNFRREVESGRLEITEMTALSLEAAIEASGRNLPFLPFTGLDGPDPSEILSLHPDRYRSIPDPFGGEGSPDVTVVRPLQIDVAIVHASRADVQGNAQFDGSFAIDDDLAKAADRVIVTCEEIVPRSAIESDPHKTKIPGVLVDAVIEAPFGAHPTTHVPAYGLDGWELLDYAEAAAAEDRQDAYLERIRGETEDEYRERVLGDDRAAILRALVDAGTRLEARDA